MTLNDIEKALRNHLELMTDCPPIVYGNKSASHAKPYLNTLHAPVLRVQPTTDGSVEEDKTGLWLVTIVSESDTFTTEANTLAEAVSQRFKQGRRITGVGGKVLVSGSEPVQGFHDKNNDWNVPVRITYRTET